MCISMVRKSIWLKAKRKLIKNLNLAELVWKWVKDISYFNLIFRGGF